ncbi:AraC family transcriptional regulator [Anopheles sinensis]|uniref:AraC family transcriptional regulator n=1 Tax=Anopheles sinensis TaxID=74873 RepID=A0A084VA02_ANOSI|nr:AraC family transcriptional regulator [Anopheles sinensis]
MDSEDRSRLDSNLDKLRCNEESLKRRLEGEVGVVTALYDMVANATKIIDEKMSQNDKALEVARVEWREGIQDVNYHRQMIRMEQELLKLHIWIKQLVDNIHRMQRISLNVLMGQKLTLSDLLTLVDPLNFVAELERIERSLPAHIGFPRKGSGEINSNIFGLIKQGIAPQNKVRSCFT